MPHRLLHGAACLCLALAALPAVWAVDEWTWTISPAPSGLSRAKFELWLPDTIGTGDKVRGLLGVANHEGGAVAYVHAGWRDLAAEQRFGIIRYELRDGNGQTTGSSAAWNALMSALQRFSTETGHPELAHAGLIPSGLSRGGMQTIAFVNLTPARIIAAVPFHGGGAPTSNASTRLVPVLAHMGETDTLVTTLPSVMLSGRPDDARWAGVMQQGTQHATIGSQDLAVAFMRAAIQARVPGTIPTTTPPVWNIIPESAGGLGRMTLSGRAVTAATAHAYGSLTTAEENAAHWLPTLAVAQVWARYSLNGGDPEAQRVSVRPTQDAIEGSGALSFSITRAGDIGAVITVNWEVVAASSTATAGADFSGPTSGSVEMKFRRPTANISIPTLADAVAEGDETVVLRILPGTGYTVDPLQAVAVIRSPGGGPANQPPVAVATVSDDTPAVGQSVTFSASGSSDPDGTIAEYFWSFANGQVATGATVTRSFASAGLYDVLLTVTDDDGASTTTTVPVVVGASPAAPGTLAFALGSMSVSEGAGTVALTVSRSGGSDGAIGVSWSTANGTATAGSDYTAASGTLTWAAGESTAKTITVPITADTAVEATETFSVVLASPTGGATLGTATATVSILDDDTAGTAGSLAFDVATYYRREGQGGMVCTVRRTGGSTGAAGVSYATASGTATAGQDFTTITGTLTWADGDSANKTFSIPLINDSLPEPEERFTITLSGVTGAVLGTRSTATGVIPASDTPPTLTQPATASPSTVMVGTTTQLSAAANDVVGEGLTWSWTIVSGPAGGLGLSAADANSTAASALAAGTYVIRVTATDADGQTTSSEVTVTVDEVGAVTGIGAGGSGGGGGSCGSGSALGLLLLLGVLALGLGGRWRH